MSHCNETCVTGPCDCCLDRAEPARERYGVLVTESGGIIGPQYGVLVRVPSTGSNLREVAKGRVDHLREIAADLNGEPRPAKGTVPRKEPNRNA